MSNGKCECKSGVDGDKCNKCKANHWNFGLQGCESMIFTYIGQGDRVRVQNLIAQGIDLNSKNRNDETVFDVANRINNKPMLDIILKKMREDVKKNLAMNLQCGDEDYYGSTELHVASAFGYRPLVDELIANGLDVDAIDKNCSQRSPIHFAALRGHSEVVQSLIEAKANVNARDVSGETPLHFSAINGDTEIIRLLVNANASINCKTNHGNTPLHYLASAGYVDGIKLLIEAGANLDVQRYDGASPLHLAIMNEHDGVTQLLIDTGAPQHLLDSKMKSPMDYMKSSNII